MTDARTATNQAPALVGHDVVTSDVALTDALARHGTADLVADLTALGVEAGSAEAREHGMLANRHHPELTTYDRWGNRVDEVAFHPSWHWLMERAVGHGLQAAPWEAQEAGDPYAHLRRAAGFFAWSQTEPGHGCPISMTYAAVPALRADDAIAKEWTPLLAARSYDPGVRARSTKTGALAGMGMTEKQGGSDVRANQTRAVATADDGWYELHGHKWFTSAPMNDVFLVLAQADGGVTCFVVPRVLDDGTRNRLDVVRLKDKLGNRSNASSELELSGTLGQRLGDEGRGVRTIIEMVAATRLDCVLGSAALMRHALAEAPTARRSAACWSTSPSCRTWSPTSPSSRRPRPRWRCAWPPPSTVPATRTRWRCAGSRCHWRSSGSASARPRWSRRRWSASAATATSRTPGCR
jgi:putative acyl-CoA dehydrogenase